VGNEGGGGRCHDLGKNLRYRSSPESLDVGGDAGDAVDSVGQAEALHEAQAADDDERHCIGKCESGC